MSIKFKRGDVVAYNNYLYFFEPDGNYGNLYHNSEEVGVHSKVAVHARRSKIRSPDEMKKRQFLALDKARIDVKPMVVPPRLYWAESDDESLVTNPREDQPDE